MTIVELLALLERRHVHLDLDGDGRLVVESATDISDLVEDIGTQALDLAWHVRGRRSGHAWKRCDHCGEVRLVTVTGNPQRCRLTHGCEGKTR